MHAVSASLRAWANPATTSSNDHSSLGNGPIAIVSAGSRPAAGTFDSYVGGKARSASAAVGAARRKHFLRADHALVSGAGVHHVENLDLIRDVFIVGNRAVSVRVDLVHHGLGPKAAGIAAGGESREI